MALSVTRVSQVLDIRQNYRQFGGVNNKEEFEAVECNLNSFNKNGQEVEAKERRSDTWYIGVYRGTEEIHFIEI